MNEDYQYVEGLRSIIESFIKHEDKSVDLSVEHTLFLTADAVGFGLSLPKNEDDLPTRGILEICRFSYVPGDTADLLFGKAIIAAVDLALSDARDRVVMLKKVLKGSEV